MTSDSWNDVNRLAGRKRGYDMRKLFFAAIALPLAVMATPASANGGLSFIIDGDTFDQPYSVTNNSTAGEKVLRFGFDLTGTDYIFDTVTGGPPGNGTVGVPFTPRGMTGTDTGLVTPVTVADGAAFFQIDFTNFTVGKTFSWDIDIDPANPNRSATVLGSNLIGAKAFVDFSNGLRGNGLLQAVSGRRQAAAFNIITLTPTPSVPEPTTWVMMLLGFGAVGYAMRRKTALRYA